MDITPESKQQSMGGRRTSSPVKIKRCESAQLSQQSGALFCWWSHKGSTQVHTAQLYGSSEEHCKTNGMAIGTSR
ncbi:hypothetical protein TNCT_184011 [Trichonephila clavata]|uniref:Uncharacterized protein n=1 Tax=Trichonephila clavata TaxID=2740835 RepID=A0A8X6FMH8_TRICU|nr:hypothetical protein TNCT_184011 [Trichonephila clavata]